jgi:hypothetical protein
VTYGHSPSDNAFDQSYLIASNLFLVSGENDCQMNKVKQAVPNQYGVPGGARQNTRPSLGSGYPVLDKSNLLPINLFNPRSDIVLWLMAILFQIFRKL